MRILILTSVYKDEELGNRDGSTNIVNSFVHNWIKQGHEVIVVHNSHCYPRIVHDMPHFVKKKLASKLGFGIADYDVVGKKQFIDRGAKVFRIPIKKYIPHVSPSRSAIIKQIKLIKALLTKEKFAPDVIIGHWASPQMEIISELKKKYDCKTAVVLHGTDYVNSPKFHVERYLPYIDRIGARSLFQAKEVQRILNLKEQPFICYSGVPDEYLASYNLNTEKFKDRKVWKFAYVGRLVEYKNVDATIKALASISDFEWELNIVGDGAMRAQLEFLAKELKCSNRVHFLGKIPRDEVMKVLSDTNCFVMISSNEIFGLVYLEAMAASCITIASKNGGIDGIIKNEINGYLCEQGNSAELVQIIEKVRNLNYNEITNLVSEGYRSAKACSDTAVAKEYLNNVFE